MCKRDSELKKAVGLVLAALGAGIFLFAVLPSCVIAVVLAGILIAVGILILLN